VSEKPITKADLEGTCETIRRETGDDSYSIGYMDDGRARLYREHEAREVSPWLPVADLYRWLWAWLDGVRVGMTKGGAT